MFGRRLKIATLLGFAVYVDLSWLFLAALITWSLATGVFPIDYPALAPTTYWAMGATAAIGLFISILSHELAHSVVARRFGIPIRGITLFIFGGVAEMEGEPPSAKSEFLMAAAGPLWSIFLAGLFYLAASAGAGWNPAVRGTLSYLALMNAMLAAFNILPAFPLDGGRVFRAGLWHLRRDFAAATRTAAHVGSWFGLGFMILGAGVFLFTGGQAFGGIWWVVIGLFLRAAAQSELVRLNATVALGGRTVGQIMTRNPVSVSGDLSVARLVDEYVYRYFHDSFPVLDGGRLVGIVGVRQLESLPPTDWPKTPVRNVMRPIEGGLVVEPGTPALNALAQMQKSQVNRLLVAETGRLLGIVTARDVMQAVDLASRLGKIRAG